MRSSLLTMSAGASQDQDHFGGKPPVAPPRAADPLHPLVQQGASGLTTLSVPTALGLADGGTSNGGVWVTAPQATRHRWEKCPHHKGECPGCGEDVLDRAKTAAAKPLKVSKALAAADPSLARALDRLIDLSNDEDHADLAIGGGQRLFKTLKARLPDAIAAPPKPKAKNWLQAIAFFFDPPKTPADDAEAVLDRAMKAHHITADCRAAARKLPLEGKAEAVSAETRRKMAVFLVYLAEQLNGGAASKLG